MSQSTAYTPKLRLLVIRGSQRDLVYQPEGDATVSLGRDSGCDLVLNDRGVSRFHCKIEPSDGGWLLVDVGSTNGVLLFRSPSELPQLVKSDTLKLSHGDELEVGEARIRIEICDDPLDATELIHHHLLNSTELLVRPAIQASEPSVTGESKEASNGPRSPVAHEIFSSPVATKSNSLTRSVPFNFGRYRVLKKIGEGGMGAVYLASDEQATEGRLAIKFLHCQKDVTEPERARFLREMEIAVQLRHPSIVDCLDCGDENNQLFMVMPYCDGGNLADMLKRTGRISTQRALRLLDRLLGGMEHAHKSGIVHRDLKPFNILLAKQGERKYVPKICDFGLAKSYLLAGSSGMTVNGTVGGSWAYMPKEQLTDFRFVSPQSDVWSLGAILYECLTGRLPRPIKPNDNPIHIILESKVVPISQVHSEIPSSIADFVMKALSSEVHNRFKDACEMRAELQRVTNHEGISLQ